MLWKNFFGTLIYALFLINMRNYFHKMHVNKFIGILSPLTMLSTCMLMFVMSSQAVLCAEKPFTFQAVYTGEAWSNTTGGLDTGSEYLSNTDLQFDAQIFNGTLFLYGLYTNNNVLSETLVGDIQGASNIDSGEVLRMIEAWYYHDLGSEIATFKAGLIDLNSNFDAIEPAGLFINSSHGIGPDFSQTGANGPSVFPASSLGAEFEIIPDDSWHFRIGLFDAVPHNPDNPDSNSLSLGDGTLLLSEINYRPNSRIRYAVGAWRYSPTFESLENPAVLEDGNWGAYGFISGDLYQASNNGTGLTGWFRYGYADNSDINFLQSYLGAGLVYTGLIPARSEDQLGLAVASVFIGGAGKRVAEQAGDAVAHAETNLELTYRAQISNWLALQPSIQYIINPGIVGGLDNALVIGLRFELSAVY